MTDTARLLTMTAEQFECATSWPKAPLDGEHGFSGDILIDKLQAEVLAQAARVLALEQENETHRRAAKGGMDAIVALRAHITALEQERERIRQALEKFITALHNSASYKAGRFPGEATAAVTLAVRDINELLASLGET